MRIDVLSTMALAVLFYLMYLKSYKQKTKQNGDRVTRDLWNLRY